MTQKVNWMRRLYNHLLTRMHANKEEYLVRIYTVRLKPVTYEGM